MAGRNNMPELDGVKYDYTPSGIKKYYKAKADKKKKSQYPSAKDEYVDQKTIKKKGKRDRYAIDHWPKEQDKPRTSLTPVGKSQKLIGQMKGVGGGGVPKRYKKKVHKNKEVPRKSWR